MTPMALAWSTTGSAAHAAISVVAAKIAANQVVIFFSMLMVTGSFFPASEQVGVGGDRIFKILVDLIANLLVDLHVQVDRDRLVRRLNLQRRRARDGATGGNQKRSCCESLSSDRIRHSSLRY